MISPRKTCPPCACRATILALAWLSLLAPCAPAATPKVREAAVAGLFYPAEASALGANIDAMLAAAEPAPLEGRLRALICPHAGYAYSGPIAASAYRLLQGRSYDTVFVLAPSHNALLRGASVSGADVYRTPLGEVPIPAVARRLAELPPFALEPACEVRRPSWWPSSSRLPPRRGEERADTWEHADEVQVPFLQKTLTGFGLVPVIFGQVDAGAAARSLSQVVDDRTLIIVSSDLSHYRPYDEAREIDQRCIEAICRLDAGGIADEQACGKVAIATLLHLARLKGWSVKLLDYRNSGDTAGDKSGVVGYAAIAFTEKPVPEQAPSLSPEDRRTLLALARQAVAAAAAGERPPALDPVELPAGFLAAKGCFVTLTKAGDLRGCIGHILPQEPLWLAVRDNARSSALRDPRFPMVAPDEVPEIEIEISVLTVPEPLAFSSPEDLLAKLEPHRDGVVLHVEGGVSTFLPQVWESLPEKEEFLNHLAAKAGRAPGAWRRPGTTVEVYRVESFSEAEMRNAGPAGGES